VSVEVGDKEFEKSCKGEKSLYGKKNIKRRMTNRIIECMNSNLKKRKCDNFELRKNNFVVEDRSRIEYRTVIVKKNRSEDEREGKTET